jgi:hypothetical protein
MPLIIDNKKNLPAVIPERPSFLQTMKEGVALGIGSSIGHRMVGAVMGAPAVKIPSAENNVEYEKCIKESNDKLGCEYLLK